MKKSRHDWGWCMLVLALSVHSTWAATNGLFSLSAEQVAHLQDFKRLAEDVGKIEDKYRNCVEKIPWLDYRENKVMECVGLNYELVSTDVEFEKYKITSQAESKLREIILNDCYSKATEEKTLVACDLLERDAVDLLWNELNLHASLEANKVKYMFEQGKMDQVMFETILAKLEPLNSNISELINETDNHKDLAVVRLKTFVDQRTKEILALARDRKENPKPRIRKQVIQIEERVTDKNNFNLHLLPKPMLLNGSPDFYDAPGQENEYIEEIKKAQPDLFPSFENAPHAKLTPDIVWQSRPTGVHSLLLTAGRALRSDPRITV